MLQDGDVQFLNCEKLIVFDCTKFAEYLNVAARTLEWLKFTLNNEWCPDIVISHATQKNSRGSIAHGSRLKF